MFHGGKSLFSHPIPLRGTMALCAMLFVSGSALPPCRPCRAVSAASAAWCAKSAAVLAWPEGPGFGVAFIMGKAWKSHGKWWISWEHPWKTQGKIGSSWENHGKQRMNMYEPLTFHGKIMGKPSRYMKNDGDYD